jgi:hypothetical protein
MPLGFPDFEAQALRLMHADAEAKARPVIEAQRQGALTRVLLRGDSLYDALTEAVRDLTDQAPAEHDILVEAFGIYVTKIGFIEPHAFLLSGYDDSGNETSVVAHFSQLITRVVYLPKKGLDRVITGFARVASKTDVSAT